MQTDHIGVVQVVFRRELIGRVDEKADEKSRRGQQNQTPPVAHTAVKGGDAQQENQRIEGEQVASQQSTPEH